MIWAMPFLQIELTHLQMQSCKSQLKLNKNIFFYIDILKFSHYVA